MEFGICIPNHWGLEDVHDVFKVATRAEELGFDSVWVSEHVFNVSYVHERIGARPYYEPLTVLTYVAAITSRVGLGTSVLVLPYHNPIRLAKIAATLDVISGGRLILGVGVGVIEEELDAMGSPFSERGSISDESIAVMKALWTEEEPSHRGKYHRFSGMGFAPKPRQKPHIPLLIGGASHAAIRRVVRSGDGWHPSNLAPETLEEGIGYLRRRALAAGRDPSRIPVSIRLELEAPGGHTSTTHPRYSLGTEPEEIVRNSRRFEELGVTRIVLAPNTGDVGTLLATMKMLASKVMPVLA